MSHWARALLGLAHIQRAAPLWGGAGLTARIAWVSAVIAIALIVTPGVFLLAVGRTAPWVGLLPFALATAAYAAPALAIALRQPENRLHWVLRVISIALPVWLISNTVANAWLHDPIAYPIGPIFAWAVGWLSLLLILAPLTLVPLLFPTGRPPTERWRPFVWYVIGDLLLLMLATAVVPGPMTLTPYFGNNPFGIAGPLAELPRTLQLSAAALLLPAILGCVASVIVRFRRARGIERQQMKWFAYAVAMCTTCLLLSSIVREAQRPAEPSGALRVANDVFLILSFVLPPIAIGVAVLRYRLYDIDLLINRTLVYGTLTALLAGVFAATQEVLKRMFVGATGQSSDAAVVVALFFIATLFTPARSRLQRAVDSRFRPVQSVTVDDAVLTPAARALRDLARLRAEGIVSDVEFEAKKAELLARL